MLRSLLVPMLLLSLALVACTGADTPVAEDDAPDVVDAQAEPEDAEEVDAPRECRVDASEDDTIEDDGTVELPGADAVALSHELARRTHRCTDVAVVADDDPWAAALAVAVAVDADAPLLLADPDDPSPTLRVADRLEPRSRVLVTMDPYDHGEEADEAGDEPGDEPDRDVDPEEDGDTGDAARDDPAGDDVDGETVELAGADAGALSLAVIEHLGADRVYAIALDDDDSRVAALARNGGDTPLLPIPEEDEALAELAAALPATVRVEVVAGDDDLAAALSDRLTEVGVDAEPVEGPHWEEPDAGGTLWLVDPAQRRTAAVVAATAAGRGDAVLPVDADDLRAGRDRTSRFVDVDPSRSILVGEMTDDASWQLPLLLDGPRLPTGGLLLFEDDRMVALYGTPSSTVLGVLGEQQDIDATVERAREVAEPYGADGVEVVPAFEMIVTIASAEAGARGDYSRRLDPDSFRPWIDRAAEEGFYVVLDLQPGRTDFLEQAQEYEDLLREPHVGLALDPEWRLEDDQVHLRQIGNVAAEEVQRVADWLAELTREHTLPQKLLVLHQFRHSMLPDRDTIEAPPELAVVVHMDGQGPIGTKYDTYASLTAGAEDRWWWGWKNFYDEDDPTPTPEQVLDLDPLPVFVSYQ